MYVISSGDRLTGFGTPDFNYNSLDEFINNFPYSERQCTIQIERELIRNGHFIFSDLGCPFDYMLTLKEVEYTRF